MRWPWPRAESLRRLRSAFGVRDTAAPQSEGVVQGDKQEAGVPHTSTVFEHRPIPSDAVPST